MWTYWIMRRSTLKPDQNGEYYRNLGWKKTRTGQRSQHKFLLGTNKKEAEARNALLERVWQPIEERYGAAAEWGGFAFEVAKAIAKGETEIPYERRKDMSSVPGVAWCYERDTDYARAFNQMQAAFPFIKLVPESPDAYQRGV